MASISISPQAQSDLNEIKEYIISDLDNPTAATSIIAKIIAAIRRLEDFPDMGSPLAPILEIETEFRFLICGNYLVFYRHENDAV